MKNSNIYILTLSCPDRKGIVAAVTGFLSDNGGFIMESSQFGDDSTGSFFMRVKFNLKLQSVEALFNSDFNKIAKNFVMQWRLKNCSEKERLLVLVSREEHCLHNLLFKHKSGILDADIVAVISNHRNLQETTESYNIPFHYLPVTSKNRQKQESEIIKIIEKEKIDLVVLARYMQIFSADLSQFLLGRAINIHHSFLPSFKGAKPYEQAYNTGVKIIGATAHYVTKDLDNGPIIEQDVVRVSHNQTADDLKKIGSDIESHTLVKAIKYHIEQRVILNGNKTVVF